MSVVKLSEEFRKWAFENVAPERSLVDPERAVDEILPQAQSRADTEQCRYEYVLSGDCGAGKENGRKPARTESTAFDWARCATSST